MKQDAFKRESGGLEACTWRGCRGSELARGKCKELIWKVQQDSSSSVRLQERIACLPLPQQRACRAALQSMTLQWCEE
eukprot:8405814-Prorocentrum_lima.AAC.1